MTKHSESDETRTDEARTDEARSEDDQVLDPRARDLNATANPEVGDPAASRERFTAHSAPQGEGITSAFLRDGNDVAETSVFDGAGNEAVVVVGQDDEGRWSEGTGPDRAAALKNMKEGKDRLGKDFSPSGGH